MMNKSKIDWCDFSWNPVTGCGHGCEYCYARALARRFSGDMRISIKDPQVKNVEGPAGPVYVLENPYKTQRGKTLAFPAGFEPTLHEYRLPDPARKKKPASIFVCSMADLFAEAVPDEWIGRVFDACRAAPWHRYMFLTKNPDRYRRLDQAGALPRDANFWYGTTVTNLADASSRLPLLPRGVNRFASAEPIMGPIDMDVACPGAERPVVDWLIVGAETGNRRGKVTLELEWITCLTGWAHMNGVPVLVKLSPEMWAVWKNRPGIKVCARSMPPAEFPEDLAPMPPNDVPHCKGCDKCTSKAQGDRGNAYYCADGWEADGYDDRGPRHIPGRYTRTSPPWCPERRKK